MKTENNIKTNTSQGFLKKSLASNVEFEAAKKKTKSFYGILSMGT